MKCPKCGAKTEKVSIDRYDCTKGCGVYLIHKLRTHKSKYKGDKTEG